MLYHLLLLLTFYTNQQEEEIPYTLSSCPASVIGTEKQSTKFRPQLGEKLNNAVAYLFTDREDNRKAQRKFALVRDYKRSNGSILSKDFQSFPYQERCVKTENKDAQKLTERIFEMFVSLNPAVV
jgi:hypothetical protein